MNRGRSLSSAQLEIRASNVQFMAAFTSLLGAFCVGATLSWTSPAISSMQNERVVQSEMSFILQNSNTTKTEEMFLDKHSTELVSWMISIVCIGALAGSFITGSVCEWLGHRWFLCFSGLLCAVGWLCVSFAINTTMVLIGRFITGFAIGCLSSSVNVYVVEICTMKCRGFLGCSFQGFITLGTLFISVCGMFVEWRLLSQLCIIPAVLLSVLILFFPESPFWLVKQGREEDALRSLQRLRANEDCTMELNLIIEQVLHAHQPSGDSESLDEEAAITAACGSVDSLRSGGGGTNRIISDSIVNISKAIDRFNVDFDRTDVRSSSESEDEDRDSKSPSSFLRHLKQAHVWKPLLFGLIVMSYQQLSGVHALFASLQEVLDSAKFDLLNEQQAAIVVNFCFACFAWLSTYTVNLFGRRTLLMFSSFGYIVAYLMIGGYYLAKENHYDELAKQLNYVPLVALILFFFVHAVGYGSVCWFVVPEMAISYRNQISSLCVAVNWIMNFVVMKNFTILVGLINYSGTFGCFVLVGVVSAITVLLLIPETKDKTARQIKAQFYSRRC